MAAEAQRATCSRGQTSIAPLPRATADPVIALETRNYTGDPLELFGQVPAWAVAHAMRDDSMAPLIRAGEVVVVESDGKPGLLPEEGKLYLIEYVSPPRYGERYERRTRDIVTPFFRRGSWWVGPLCQRIGQRLFMSDGPYRDEDALASRLIGRVVGIYSPPALAGVAA